jgi:hypothetical protein
VIGGLSWLQVLFLVLIAAVLIFGFLVFLRRIE